MSDELTDLIDLMNNCLDIIKQFKSEHYNYLKNEWKRQLKIIKEVL